MKEKGGATSRKRVPPTKGVGGSGVQKSEPKGRQTTAPVRVAPAQGTTVPSEPPTPSPSMAACGITTIATTTATANHGRNGSADTMNNSTSCTTATNSSSKEEDPVTPVKTGPTPQAFCSPDRTTSLQSRLSSSLSNSIAASPFSPGAKLAITSRLPPAMPVFNDCEPDEGFTIDVSHLSLTSKLAEGAYGVVLAGTYHGEQVAVKVQSVPNEEYEQVNILSELSVLKNLQHPRLVHYKGAALLDPTLGAEGWGVSSDMWAMLMMQQQQQQPVTQGAEEAMERKESTEGMMMMTRVLMVMELCVNGALREGLQARLGWELKVRIAADVAEGLAALHGFSLIHRDLKTTNILLDGAWRAKLCDHSFAIGDTSPEMATFTCGTTEFMAPEVSLGEPYDAKSDIFSFGVVLCELICEKVPGTDSGFLVRQPKARFELDPAEVEAAVLPGYPPSLLNLALQCTKTDPEMRPSAREAQDWLQSLLTEMMGGEDLPVPLPTTTPPPPSPERRRDRARYRRRTRRGSSLNPPPPLLSTDGGAARPPEAPLRLKSRTLSAMGTIGEERSQDKAGPEYDSPCPSKERATAGRRMAEDGEDEEGEEDWGADDKPGAVSSRSSSLSPSSSSSSSSHWSSMEMRRDVDSLLAWRERMEKRREEGDLLARRVEELEAMNEEMARTIRLHDRMLRDLRGGTPLSRQAAEQQEEEGEGGGAPPIPPVVVEELPEGEILPRLVEAVEVWDGEIDRVHGALKASLRGIREEAGSLVAGGGKEGYRERVVKRLEELEAVLAGQGADLVAAVADSLQVMKLKVKKDAVVTTTTTRAAAPEEEAQDKESGGHRHHHHHHGRHHHGTHRHHHHHKDRSPIIEKASRAEEKEAVMGHEAFLCCSSSIVGNSSTSRSSTSPGGPPNNSAVVLVVGAEGGEPSAAPCEVGPPAAVERGVAMGGSD